MCRNGGIKIWTVSLIVSPQCRQDGKSDRLEAALRSPGIGKEASCANNIFVGFSPSWYS
ncbi:hypothetical protein KDI_48370 [Dictyobacter arantiisoli]|uniref:Uncharacterized protein n=1 Tax=Dictyobacter arantiisoli TaxID=2014874 RepID=A0A5A5TJS1_9CHLR|nr:hypothetical protein KDI_48370 [Dictyobacter arantiisoli]